MRWCFLLLLSICVGCGNGCEKKGNIQRASNTGFVETIEQLTRLEWSRCDSGDEIKEFLRHSHPEIRSRAALVVGRAGFIDSAGILVGLLRDPNPMVRRQTIFVLRLLVLDGPKTFLKKFSVKVLQETLIKQLSFEKHPETRMELIQTLGWIGDETTAATLVHLFETPDARAAITAWGILANRGTVGEGQEGCLLPLLSNRNTEEGMLAAWALTKLPCTNNPKIVEALKNTIEDPNAETRLWATQALGRCPPSKHLEWLLARMDDYDPRVQIAAAQVLGLGDARVAVRLTQKIKQLWERVSASYFRLTGPNLHSVLVGLRALWPNASVPTVQQFAQDILDLSDATDATVKYGRQEAHSVDLIHCAAAQLLDLGLGRPEYTPTCGTMQSEDLTVYARRVLVARLIGRMARSPKWKMVSLRRYLHDPLARVRVAAVETLGTLESAEARVAVHRAVSDPDLAVLNAAAAVIAKKKEWLFDGDLGKGLTYRLAGLDVRSCPITLCKVVKALGTIRFKDDLPLLMQLQKHANPTVRDCTVAAIAAIVGKEAEAGVQTKDCHSPPSAIFQQKGDTPTRAVLVTHRGEILLELFAKEAPAAVANFVRLSHAKAFSGERFEDVVPNLFITAKAAKMKGDKNNAKTIPDEFTSRPFVRGSVGVFSEGRDTASTQFFITIGRQPEFDGRYTQFARVLEGMTIVESIQTGDEIKDLYILN
ncbi:MAG: HEAT repeat domain-containing protein [Pseudomonadota bacterium]